MESDGVWAGALLYSKQRCWVLEYCSAVKMSGRESALVAGLLEQSKVASTGFLVPLVPNTGKLIQVREANQSSFCIVPTLTILAHNIYSTKQAARKSHPEARQLLPTGHRQGGKELVQSRQYLVLSAALAGEPPSRLPRGQADAATSVAPEAVEQPVGATHGRKQG